jgi:hypothetical protein
MKQFILILTLVALVPALAFGVARDAKRPAVNYPALAGDETVNATVAPSVIPEVPAIDEADLIGDTIMVGNTWYGNQHNGTCGRMNTIEPDGWRQFSWMKGEEATAINRHIWWNGVDPNGTWVFPFTGVAVESSLRGGFVNMDVGSNGAGFPCYHNTTNATPTLPITATSMDLIPHAGAFLDFQGPVNPSQTQIIWPRMQIGQNQRLHIFSTNQVAAAGDPQRMWYNWATYNPTLLTMTYNPTWQEIDWTMTIAGDVAVSPVAGSNKTLWAWTRNLKFPASGQPNPDCSYSQLDNDVYYLIDDDGLNPNFAARVNLTHFLPPNLALLPDTLAADQDTLRAYTCLGAFIDASNWAHIVFTTRSYFAIEGTSYWNASLIWHWSQQYPDSFRVVGSESYFAFNNNVDCGAWNVKAQRPTLGQAANGNLYCMYQVYDTDTLHLSAAPNFMPSGEIFVSYSTNGGLNWTQGTNVTSTITANGAPAGSCWSELTPTMAKKVDTYCHIEYVVDKDAGNVLQTEGTWTNNPVKYHRVPVASLNSALVVQTKNLHIQSQVAALDVTLTPVGAPIVIGPGGGSFQFNASVRRVLGPQAPFWVWARMKYPSGLYSGPTLGPVQINPPVGVTISRLRIQNIPSTHPAGVTTYLGYANTASQVYPAVDSSFFTFTKTAVGSEGSPWVNNYDCYGEPFPGEIMATTPDAFTLVNATPNPFNPVTTLSFTLPEASRVNLKVYDASGREVATLVDGQREAGNHQVTFDGSELSSGVYFYTLTAGSHVATGKMALVK